MEASVNRGSRLPAFPGQPEDNILVFFLLCLQALAGFTPGCCFLPSPFWEKGKRSRKMVIFGKPFRALYGGSPG